MNEQPKMMSLMEKVRWVALGTCAIAAVSIGLFLRPGQQPQPQVDTEEAEKVKSFQQLSDDADDIINGVGIGAKLGVQYGYFQKAYANANLENWPLVPDYLRHAQAANPEKFYKHTHYGWIADTYAEKGKYDEAIAMYEEALVAMPGNLNIRAKYGALLASTKADDRRDMPRGIIFLREYVDQDAEDHACRALLAKALANTGAWDEALKYGREASRLGILHNEMIHDRYMKHLDVRNKGRADSEYDKKERSSSLKQRDKSIESWKRLVEKLENRETFQYSTRY